MKYIFFILLLLAGKLHAQSCTGASAISSSGTTHNSTTINFTANQDVINYVIVYYTNPLIKTRQNINDPGPSYPVPVTAPINSLTPSSNYSYYIVTKCNAGDSVISATFNFTTTAAPCDTVTGLTVSPITSTSAYIFATPYQYATSYTLKYVKQGNIDTVTVGPSVNPTWQINNLLSNTIYAYRIISTCPVGTNSAAGTFTTLQLAVTYTPMTAFGYRYKRTGSDSTHDIPEGTTPSLRNGDPTRANIFYDSLHKIMYVWDAPEQEWNSVTGCTTTIETFSDSTSGPVTGATDWAPTISAVSVLVDREVLFIVRNSITLTLDVDYTFDPQTGTISFTDVVLAEESFTLGYSCGSSGSTLTEAVTYTPQQFTDGATVTLNFSQGRNWYGTIAGNRTFVISNMPNGQYLTVKVTQGSGGSHTLSLPSGSKIVTGQGSGTTPVLSTVAGKYDILTVYKDETGGYNWTIGLDYQ